MYNNDPATSPDSMTPPAKSTLQQLREQHHFGIVELAASAAVSTQIVYYMLLGEPVPYESAVSVLNTLTEQTGEHYTLENVNVRLASPSSIEAEAGIISKKLSFRSLRNKHWFNADDLAAKACMAPDVILRMILNEPVPRDYAVLVLVAYNEQFGEHYTLDMPDVKFSKW